MGRSMRCSQEEKHLNETDDEDLSWRHFADVGACADNYARCSVPVKKRISACIIIIFNKKVKTFTTDHLTCRLRSSHM